MVSLDMFNSQFSNVLKQNTLLIRIVIAFAVLYFLNRLYKKWKYSHKRNKIKRITSKTNNSNLPNDIYYTNIPIYRVNLDEAASTRWNHVVLQYMNEFDIVWEIVDKFANEILPPICINAAKYMFSILIYLRLFPHSNEWIGIAKTIKRPVGELGLMHFTYELTSFCTSILINDKSIFKTIINLRIMDWSLPFDLRQFTAKVHFVNNNNDIIYTSVMFIGSLGVTTALKTDKFSIVINFRNSAYNNIDKSSYITLKTVMGFIYNFSMIFIGGWSVTSFARYVCENANDYNEAVEMGKESWLIAPTFITITGNKLNEGVILTRDRMRCLDMNVFNNNDNSQYLVQCNSDHWTINELNKYSDIYESKERVEMAEDLLPLLLIHEKENDNDVMNIVDNEYKNNEFTNEQLKFISKCWRLISVYPIRNEETVYSNIIIPKHKLILSGKTTTEFEAVTAKEFKDMFYMSADTLNQTQNNVKK
eukprot:461836_1